MDALPPPLLQREPDGHEGPLSLFPEATPLYLALMLGVGVAGLSMLWNAVMVGRWGRAALAVVVGIGGSIGCTALLLVLLGSGVSAPIARLASDVAAVALGAGMYLAQRPVVRGHRLLGGALVPVWPVLIGAFALQLVLPSSLRTWIHHPLLAMFLELSP